MLDNAGFWRKVLVSHPPGGVSTAETRAEGLAVLKAAFMSNNFTNYPPGDIETIDATDIENPMAHPVEIQVHVQTKVLL
jgi:hypothetical protein